MKSHILIFMTILSSCSTRNKKDVTNTSTSEIFDSHVHLMSPELIESWKKIGIPFSKSDANYSNIDTILKNNGAERIDLIGMGYVYGNPEYYQGSDSHERLIAENNYLLKAAKKHLNKVTPFFAVDPLKDYAIEEIERCYKMNSNSGLKLHFNASQVYLTEPTHLDKVIPVFHKAAEFKIPILLHFDNWHPKFGKPDIQLLADSILSQIDSIELRIAHFGTSGGFNEKTKRFIDAFLELKKQNLIPSRHRIYFDISAVALDKDSEGISQLTVEEFIELRQYINMIGVENIIFGTDHPLYNSIQYLEILRNKVGLKEKEIEEILKKDTATNNG